MVGLLVACTGWFGDSSAGKDQGDNSGDSATSASDSGGGGGGFCDRDISDEAPGGPECVTDTISCGDQITGRTGGGSTDLDADLYDQWFCGYPYPADYDGPERVYVLDVQGSNSISVSLDSPCEEVDLFAIHWVDDGCPYDGVSISECENGWKDGGDSLSLFTDQSYRFLLIVEPRTTSGRAADTNFRLSVDCTPL
jgi:hypothetical protein